MENTYSFVRFDEDKIEDLILIFRSAAKTEVTREFIKKKFNTAVFGLNSIGFIAYHNETQKPAAFYGVFPCLVMYKNKTILAAQSGDTMTHVDHQGKGLFVALAKMTYEVAKKEGVKFIFGFPNENSYPGFSKKLNWVFKEKMKKYKIGVFTIPISFIAYRIPIFLSLYKKYVHFILSLYKLKDNSFNNSVITEDFGGLYRDEAFMNYKTYSENYLIKVSGYKIWLIPGQTVLVGDIEIRDNNNSDKAIRKLKTLAFFLGIYRIDFEVSPNSAWDNILSGKYKYIESYPCGYLNLSTDIDMDKIKYTYCDYDVF